MRISAKGKKKKTTKKYRYVCKGKKGKKENGSVSDRRKHTSLDIERDRDGG